MKQLENKQRAENTRNQTLLSVILFYTCLKMFKWEFYILRHKTVLSANLMLLQALDNVSFSFILNEAFLFYYFL